jgi:uncharacterized membrane protein (GlpM family)
VVWFSAVVHVDALALAAASMAPSGPASRILMVTAIANPVDAVRTAALLGTSGVAAFGAASLALFRFTGGAAGTATALAMSLVVWIVFPIVVASRRLERADL